MCGLNAIFAYRDSAPSVDHGELIRTRDAMTIRGPDGAGAWIDPDGRIGLGHRRLAIIDVTRSGAQPMASADGALVVTFNGEIYNYRELRRQLIARGRTFRSTSDTEVLLHLYAEKGVDMLADLRGMFAFALFDSNRRTLLLARDPYGIKPLYYADDGATLRVASQVKALVAGGGIATTPDAAGWAGFYIFGSVPEPFTTHRQIKALPAGTWMVVGAGGVEASARYHNVSTVLAADTNGSTRAATGPTKRCEALRAALLDSVRHHLVADVPVGAFLSAGIDSGALVGLMRDAGLTELATVTLAFEDYRSTAADEAPLASVVARRYATRHTTRIVTRSEFLADLPDIVAAMDQPSIDGINTWFVAKAAKEIGLKVAISGLGGDELLGGYPSFSDVPQWVAALRLPAQAGLLGPRLRRTAVALGASRLFSSPKAMALLEHGATFPGAYLVRRGLFMPWELDEVMDADMAREGLSALDPIGILASTLEPDPGSDFARVAALESSIYMRNQLLRDTDWASMAHSLEVRTPLVDVRLLQQMTELRTASSREHGKSDLAAAPSLSLPMEIIRRPKTGFTTPVESWLGALEPSGNKAKRPRGRSRQWARHIARLHRGEALAQ